MVAMSTPCSLPGCFDHEEEAAKAYDKMMLWCEMHNTTGVKGGITNFEAVEYEREMHWLQTCTQASGACIYRWLCWSRRSASEITFQSATAGVVAWPLQGWLRLP